MGCIGISDTTSVNSSCHHAETRQSIAAEIRQEALTLSAKQAA
jgi:hypothetical protein